MPNAKSDNPFREDPDLAERKRNAILDVAEAIFVEKGYHETGIADIAKALEIGHGTFYRYFENKLDIALTIMDRGLAALAEQALKEDTALANNLEEYVAQSERIISTWLEFAKTHPNVLRFLNEQGQTVDVERFRAMWEMYVNYSAGFLQNGVDKGFLRADLDVEVTSQLIMGVVLEGTKRAVEANPEMLQRINRAGQDLVLMGIRAI